MSEEVSHAQRLERMKRAADYPLTIALINPINRKLVRPLARLGVAPNTVTLASFVLSLLAGAALYYAAQAALWACIAAPILVFAAHVCDALDGDLARYTERFSDFGAALDPILDRVTEVVYLVSIAAGLWRVSGDALPWILASFAIGGDLVYYYTTDAQMTRLLGAKANDPKRYTLMLGSAEKTRIKLGLYEPFMYSLALLAALGLGLEGLWVWAIVFWPAWVGQLMKMTRVVARTE